jgi:hypothetical protein
MKKLATTLALAFMALATNAQDINQLSRDEIRELKTSFVGQEGMSPENLPREYAFFDVDNDGRYELFLRNPQQTVAYAHPKRSGWTELARTEGNSQMEVAANLIVVDGMVGYSYHNKHWIQLQDGVVMSDIRLIEEQNKETGDYKPQKMTYFDVEQENIKPLLEMIAEYPETDPVSSRLYWIPFNR